MLWLGLSAIIFVPIFKMLTHLPPYVGMMLSLGIVAIFAEIYGSKYNSDKSDVVGHVQLHQIYLNYILIRKFLRKSLQFLRITSYLRKEEDESAF